jgi:hypothetical protein
MNRQPWLDHLSFGIGRTAAITAVSHRKDFPTFRLSGWRHDNDPCFARGESFAGKTYNFDYPEFRTLRDFDKTMEQMVAARGNLHC